MRGAAVANLALLRLCEQAPQLRSLSVKECTHLTRMFFARLGAAAPRLRHLDMVRVHDFEAIAFRTLATSLTTLETLKMYVFCLFRSHLIASGRLRRCGGGRRTLLPALAGTAAATRRASRT